MFTTTVVVAAGLLIGGVSPATAAENGPAPIEQRNSKSVTADPLPTVQIDSGIVWTQEVVGNTVFGTSSGCRTRHSFEYSPNFAAWPSSPKNSSAALSASSTALWPT